MKKIILCFLICSFSANAFYLGEPSKSWGLKFKLPTKKELKLRIGGRLQTVALSSEKNDIKNHGDVITQDFFVRRARLQFEAKTLDKFKFYMDLRNDNVNRGDGGEGTFHVGDTYVEVKKLFGVKGLNMRLFRAKIDVSRSETISSSKLVHPNRPTITDEAARYVSQSRRATNIQLNGKFEHLHFQIAVGDGTNGANFRDSRGVAATAIDDQNLMFGGKVRYAPFDGWEDRKLTETFMGKGKHFSFGVAGFHLGDVEYRAAGHSAGISRTLINGELSFHYRNFHIMAEYFLFKNVVENFAAPAPTKGDGEGYYVLMDFTFPKLSYIAPFVRYEKWDKFKKASYAEFDSYQAGLNWFVRGNDIQLGIAYQYDESQGDIIQPDGAGREFKDNQQVTMTTMWHF